MIRTVKIHVLMNSDSSLVASHNASERLDVENSFIDTFRLPFISGKDHRVTLKGPSLDLCDRVEIYHDNEDDDSGPRTMLRDHQLDKSNDGDPQPGSDRILEFVLNSSVLPPGLDSGFNIRVFFPPLTLGLLGGFDRLNCQTTARGFISSIEWVGPNRPLRAGVDRDSYLKAGTTYTLRFHGSGFGGAGQQFFDGVDTVVIPFNNPNLGIDTTFLTCNVQGTQISCNLLVASPLTNPIDLLTELPSFNISTSLPFAFNIIGNLVGGWGKYVYHRYAAELPNTGNYTDLSRIHLRPVQFFDEVAEVPAFDGVSFEIPFTNGIATASTRSDRLVLACGAGDFKGVMAYLVTSNLRTEGNQGLAATRDIVRPVNWLQRIRWAIGLLSRHIPLIPFKFAGLRVRMSGQLHLDEDPLESKFPCPPGTQVQVYRGSLVLDWDPTIFGGLRESINLPVKVTMTFPPEKDAFIIGRVESTLPTPLLPGAGNGFMGTFDSAFPAQIGDTATFEINNLTLHGYWPELPWWRLGR